MKQWKTGDVIQADDMNRLEGVGGFDTVFVTVEQDVQTQVNTVKSSSMTCNLVLELIEENKPVVAFVTLNLLLDGSSVGKDISSMLVNNYNSTGGKPTAAGYSIRTLGTGTITDILCTGVRFTKDKEMPEFISMKKSFS